MGNFIELKHFAESLPLCDSSLVSPSVQSDSYSLPSTTGRYVWPPTIERLEDSESNSGRITLLTAPAAMGKSSAAHALAAHSKAPLIDASRLNVGSYSISGLLSTVLGNDVFGRFLEALRANEATLIIDGLDEAQLRSGYKNYLAFLDDIVGMVQRRSSKAHVILCGREESVDTAYLHLLDSEVRVEVLEIQPLPALSAYELLDYAIDDTSTPEHPYTSHRTHKAPFEKWRGEVLSELASALGHPTTNPESVWNDVSYFLGYPPVLQVLASLLAVPNFSTANASETIAAGAARAELLASIVRSILSREAQKVQLQLGVELGMAEEDVRIRTLYGPEEQMLRIICFMSGFQSNIYSPPSLTPEEMAQYEEHLAEFVPDHPFLRGKKLANVVFSDYLLAFLSTSDIKAVHGVDSNVVATAVGRIGPFFSEFLWSLSPRLDDGSLALIRDEGVLRDAIKSHLSGSGNGLSGRPRRASMIAELDDTFILTLFADFDNNEASEMTFATRASTGVLELDSPLAFCFIDTHSLVVLNSSEGGDLLIGPGLHIYCESLQIEAQSVIIQELPYETDFPYMAALLVSEEASHDPQLQVTNFQSESFGIMWPNPSHQFRPFALTSLPFSLPDGVSNSNWQRVMMGIRSILLPFRSSVVGHSPVVFKEKMDKQIVARSPLLRALLSFFLREGLVRTVAIDYELDQDKLGEFGVSFTSARGTDPHIALRPLIDRALKDAEVQAALVGN